MKRMSIKKKIKRFHYSFTNPERIKDHIQKISKLKGRLVN